MLRVLGICLASATVVRAGDNNIIFGTLIITQAMEMQFEEMIMCRLAPTQTLMDLTTGLSATTMKLVAATLKCLDHKLIHITTSKALPSSLLLPILLLSSTPLTLLILNNPKQSSPTKIQKKSGMAKTYKDGEFNYLSFYFYLSSHKLFLFYYVNININSTIIIVRMNLGQN